MGKMGATLQLEGFRIEPEGEPGPALVRMKCTSFPYARMNSFIRLGLKVWVRCSTAFLAGTPQGLAIVS